MKALGSLALLLALGTAGCGSGDRKAESAPAAAPPPGVVILPPDSPKLREIHVQTVKTAVIPVDEVISPGKIEVNPNRVSRVVLPVTGRVTTVLVRLGDAVKQGQPLLRVASPDADAAESAYLQADAGVTQADANRVKAQADYERAADLFAHDAVAQKEVLNAQNALAQSKAAVAQAQAVREQAERRLDLLGLKPGQFGQEVVVYAPLAGKILDISVAPGEYRNDTNASVMTIADLSTVWVAADVPESYIRLVQIGEPVYVTLAAYPGSVFRARVTRIADTVDAATRTVKVRAELENPRGQFLPEMFASVRHTDSTAVSPVVPVGTVIQGEGRNYVFVERAPGRFEQVEVTVGNRTGDLLPIKSGLEPGERVVTDGAMLLKTP